MVIRIIEVIRCGEPRDGGNRAGLFGFRLSQMCSYFSFSSPDAPTRTLSEEMPRAKDTEQAGGCVMPRQVDVHHINVGLGLSWTYPSDATRLEALRGLVHRSLL